MRRTFIDRFTSLDHLSKKAQADDREVLRVLHDAGRFSVWDASENPVIARTVTRLFRLKMIEDVLDDKGQKSPYPWHVVRLTEAGLRAAGLKEVAE